MLRKDYDLTCGGDDTTWWILAACSVLGLGIVSVGFPLCMGLWMRSVKAHQDQLVRHGTKGRAIADRDFRRQFSYISVR